MGNKLPILPQFARHGVLFMFARHDEHAVETLEALAPQCNKVTAEEQLFLDSRAN